MACFSSQGSGIKVTAHMFILIYKLIRQMYYHVYPWSKQHVFFIQVYNWSGVPKHINFNKYVKCLAMSDNTLYCGCSGYSIQVQSECIRTQYPYLAFCNFVLFRRKDMERKYSTFLSLLFGLPGEEDMQAKHLKNFLLVQRWLSLRMKTRPL